MSDGKDEGSSSEKAPRLFRAFFDSAIGEAAAVLDQGGRVIGWNLAIERMTGHSASEVMNRHVSWFWPRWEELRPSVGLPRSVPASWQFEDGPPVQAVATVATIPEEDGSVAGFSLIARPVGLEAPIAPAFPVASSGEVSRADYQQVIRFMQLQLARMPVACVIFDADHRIASWNPAAERTFGFTEAEAIGKSATELAVPKYALPAIEEINRRLRQGDMSAHSINPNLTKDGRTILCRWTNTPLHDADGRFRGVLAMGEDLTEPIRAEDALRASRDLFRAVFEGALNAFLISNDEGRCVEANPAASDILGRKVGDVVGRHLSEFVGPEFDFPLEWENFLKLGRFERSIRVVRQGGDSRDVYVRSVANVLPGRHLTALRDVTEWRLEEKKRLESERLARSVLDSLPAHIAVLDESGAIVQVNRAWRVFARENGASRPASEGSNYLDVCDSSGADGGEAGDIAAAIAGGIRDVLTGRQPTYTVEYPCPSQGRELWYKAEVHPFLGEGPRRVVVSHLDVTERRETEAALKYSSDRLTILRSIDHAILSARSPEEIARTILDQVARLFPDWSGRVEAFDRETEAVRILASRPRKRDVPPVDAPGAECQRAGPDCATRIPLVHDGKRVGSLSIFSEHQPREDQLALVREVADQLAIAIRQALLYEEIASGKEHLEKISRRLIRAEEDERRRIARELHDEIGQALTAVKIHIQSAVQGLNDPVKARPRLEEGIGIVERILRQIRSISLDLRPSLLDDFGLVAALRSLVNTQARLGGFVTHLRVIADDPEFRIVPELETACFRVAQESLTNVVRYAGARYVEIELRREERWLELSVTDDGVGFDPEVALDRARSGESIGLLGMRERATLLGGQVEVESAPGRGAKLVARFPML